MMGSFNVDLMKHPADRYTAPTAYEREAHRTRRAARRAVFFAFIEAVFAQAPRHPNSMTEDTMRIPGKGAL